MSTTLRRTIGALLATAALGAGLSAAIQPAPADAQTSYRIHRADLGTADSGRGWARIHNVGAGNAGAFRIRVTSLGDGPNYHRVRRLGSGQSVTIRDSRITLSNCTSISVDHFNEVKESDEGNNIAYGTCVR